MRLLYQKPRWATPLLVSGGITVGLGGLVLVVLFSHVVINTTPSARLGLYWRRPLAPHVVLQPGVHVVLVPPLEVQAVLHRVAPHLDAARPWMKTIAAVAGDRVCLDGNQVTINGVWRAGRPLLQDYAVPTPEGCATLPADRYFVLNEHPRSFDSRYVGAFARAAIAGTLTPLYTWEAAQ